MEKTSITADYLRQVIEHLDKIVSTKNIPVLVLREDGNASTVIDAGLYQFDNKGESKFCLLVCLDGTSSIDDLTETNDIESIEGLPN